MSRRLAICFGLLCATLAYPTHARAGLGDIIWEMSGPQMVGVVVRCRVPFDRQSEGPHCIVNILGLDEESEKVWLAVEGGAYVSTGKNAGGVDYKFGRIGMFAFEPMLEFRYAGNIAAAYDRRERQKVFYGGVGPMINSFIVRGSTPAFAKYGVKLRPIAFAMAGWAVEYNLRLYPDGFTPDQFGFGPPLKFNRPFEAVHSVGVSIPYLQWKIWK